MQQIFAHNLASEDVGQLAIECIHLHGIAPYITMAFFKCSRASTTPGADVNSPYLNGTALKIIVQPKRYLRVLATLKRNEPCHRVSRIAICRLAHDLCLTDPLPS